MGRVKNIVSLIVLSLLLITCRDPFGFSPFESIVSEEFRNTTEKNLTKIHEADTSANQIFKIALLSDAHYHFNDLRDAIDDINKNKGEYAFIIVTGDLTENGLLKEFELFRQIMSQSKIPYVTVIGNHDYLANGRRIYEQMFGATNYTFTFKHVKFVMWDNTIWESEKEADWKWLSDALKNQSNEREHGEFNHVIPFSHIPPNDKQLAEQRDEFQQLLTERGVTFSVHGHKHTYSLEDLGDGIHFMTVGSPQHRVYASLTITPDQIISEKINY
jgi:3',5'-cyclic-AMP phosphodiesterase